MKIVQPWQPLLTAGTLFGCAGLLALVAAGLSMKDPDYGPGFIVPCVVLGWTYLIIGSIQGVAGAYFLVKPWWKSRK